MSNTRFTIARKMIIMALLVVVSTVIMLITEFSSMYHIERLEETRIHIGDLKIVMLQLRRNEKDFLARINLKYEDKFEKNFELIAAKLTLLREDLEAEKLSTENLKTLETFFNTYHAKFKKLIEIQKTIGLNPKHGLYGALRQAVHNAESRIKDLNDYQLMSDMLMLRRREKDFMLRGDMKYLAKFDKDIGVLYSHLEAKEYEDNTKAVIRKNMNDYEQKFHALVKDYQTKGLNSKSGIIGEMRSAVHETETLMDELFNRLSSHIKTQISASENQSLVISLIVLIILLSFIFLISRSIVRQVNTLAGVMEKSSKDKDMSMRAQLSGNDEITDMAVIYNTMMQEFENLLREVVHSSDQVQIASEKLTDISTSTSTGVQKQFNETDQLATAMHEMTATVQEVARHAQDAASASNNADEEANKGKAFVVQNKESIQQLAKEISATSDVINELSQDSESIGTVLNVIRGIAEQTNLLALNAAIEAARAGEQGRGFAVVADEVRGLAQRSQESTQEIQDIVERLQSSALKAVSAMQAGDGQAKISVEKAENASSSLDLITEAVSAISDMNIHIASAAEQQASVAEEINRNVVNISDVASETTESSAQTTTTSGQLATLAAVNGGVFPNNDGECVFIKKAA